MNPLRRYARWLHLQWPAGTVEKLPVVEEDGTTNVAGLYVVGDLRGVPLLKFSADTGAKAIRRISAELGDGSRTGDALDVAIVGAGVAGMSAALEARERGLSFRVFEASEPFSTIVNFPKGKPIYTYPKDMKPEGRLSVTADVKEKLVEELRAQTVDAGIEPVEARIDRVERTGDAFDVIPAGGEPVRARRVVLALGRSGNFRRLGVPGEDLDKVYNRLHDPQDFCGRRVLVVGGGDSACETALALARCGARVTLSYRGRELSRPKPENVEMVRELAESPRAEARVEEPGSARVGAAADDWLGEAAADGGLTLALGTEPTEIREGEVVLAKADGGQETVPNDVVFSMIGREPPLDFFRRSGVHVLGDQGPRFWATLLAFAAFILLVYLWKAGGSLTATFAENGWFPFGIERPESAAGLGGTLAIAAATPAAWFTLAYSLAIVLFGVRRIRKRRTPYITVQTLTLMAIQVIPLFLLPSVLLPWAGHAGLFGERHRVATVAAEPADRWIALAEEHGEDGAALLEEARAAGILPAAVADWPDLSAEVSWPVKRPGDRVLLHGADGREAVLRPDDRRLHVTEPEAASVGWADQLFPASEWDPQGREYWRAIGLVLAWPLFLWNVFTYQPIALWLIISLVQTFVLIPLIIFFWGKGAYCGWICSCGALAETMGDEQRHKMPHGPIWNRLNLAGQVILGAAFVLLALRVAAWMLPWDHPVNAVFQAALSGKAPSGAGLPLGFLGYKWSVDLFLAGVLGTGLYFHFSGRVWCRFFCPLAALMHVFARFSRYRILADKKKCISCNVCTAVCHQGIDVMSFANKGVPMEDPQCVRCSACVQSCPTGVLGFGQVDRRTGRVISEDPLPASPVRMREGA